MGEDNKKFGELVSKCWSDAAYKQRFLTDPKKVLTEAGIDVPENLNVKVVENTEDTMHITLPAKPSRGELSDNQLDAVAGGAGQVMVATTRTVTLQQFRTITLHTSNNDYTCSKGKECIPW